MASTPDARSSDYLHCPLCLKEFSVPRTLPCLHSFCQACLKSAILENTPGDADSFKCPVCRKDTTPPSLQKPIQEWAGMFPINSILLAMLTHAESKVDWHCDPCKIREVLTSAEAYCSTCKEALCSACLKYHRSNVSLKNHTILKIEEILNNPECAATLYEGAACPDHDNKEIEFYCEDHRAICCSSCFIADHKYCKHFIEIRKEFPKLLKDGRLDDVITKMKLIENHLKTFLAKNADSITKLHERLASLTEEVATIRRDLLAFLDALAAIVQETADRILNLESIKIERMSQNCQSLIAAVRNSHKLLQAVTKYGSKSQIFVIFRKLEEQLAHYEKEAQQNHSMVRYIDIELQLDERLKIIQTLIENKTNVQVIENCENIPMPYSNKPLRDRNAILTNALETRGPGDGKKPKYTGAVYLPDNNVFLVDWTNARCCLYDSSGKFLADFKASSQPFGICLMDENTLAISLPHEKMIQLIGVTDFINPIKTVLTKLPCWGLDSLSEEDILVSGYRSHDFYWSIVTLDGKEKTYFELPRESKNVDSTYVTLNQSKTILYISCYGNNALYSFEIDGTSRFLYKSDDLKGPSGVALDKENNVYVCGTYSNNIHQLTPDGKLLKIFSLGIPKHPVQICFKRGGVDFLVTNYDEVEKCYLMKLQ